MGNFFKNKKIDIYKILKQAWESFAIQGEMVTSLPDILPKLIQVDLHSIAENFCIKQLSKMSDKQVIARLLKLMADSKKIGQILMVARPDEFNLFTELLDVDFMEIDDMPYEKYAYLMDYGIVFSFYYKKKRYLLVADEIKDTYSNTNKPVFAKQRERYQLIYKYIKALCNFYGAFEPKQFIKIFNSFNQERISLAEFRRIYDDLSSRPQDFFSHGEYILQEYFGHVSYEEMDSFVEEIRDKPYYIPKKEELLKKAEDFYFEMTPQLTALRGYILSNMCKDKKIVDSLIEDIDLLCFMEEPFYRVVYEFKRHGILFESTRQLSTLMPLLADVYNNTRTWTNRGYTAKEMNEILGKDVPLAAPIPIDKLEDVIFKKVGRNQPCPCGSGKKYKKCCGR